jgi:mannose-6-phosphate isomerase-like protein (cupin superfamily)
MPIGETQIDNGVFRVTKWTIPPGEGLPMHVHEYPYVVVPLVDDTMHATNSDGSELTVELRIGQSYARPAGIEHSIANRGTATISFIETDLISEVALHL